MVAQSCRDLQRRLKCHDSWLVSEGRSYKFAKVPNVHFCNAEELLCNFNAPFHSSLSHILFKTVLQWRIFLQTVKIVEQSFCSVGDVCCSSGAPIASIPACSNLVLLCAGLLFASG